MDDTLRINDVVAPEASLPFLSLSGGSSGVQVLSPLLEQIAVGPTDGTVGVVVRNAAATGDGKLLLDSNNQNGVAELKVLAGGNCELNAQFQFISFNTTNGLANLAIEPNIGGSNDGEVIFGYGFVKFERPEPQGERPGHPGRGAAADLRRRGATAASERARTRSASWPRTCRPAGSWARPCARRRTWTGES